MPVFASLLLLAAGSAAALPPKLSTEAKDASLAIVGHGLPLAGISFGIDAIDGERSGYGQRLSTRVLAGRRTVWFSCPGQSSMVGGSRMSFDFEAGGRYELDCSLGRQAVIRRAEDC